MITAEQNMIIRRQLGREPRGLVRVAVEKSGIPVVLQMHPLIDDKPNPNLYWLSSTTLYQAIAGIETDGWVKHLERRMLEDPEMQAEYRENHRSYILERWRCMTPAEKIRLSELGYDDLLRRVGIGGLGNFDSIRCLHMHYAHHLVASNVIGRWLDETFALNALDIKG